MVDVFVTYFFRGAPRFVANRAGVLHLTNILGGRFTTIGLDSERKQAVVDFLNVQAKRWKTAGREYKQRLRKIEPGELSMLPVDATIAGLCRPMKRTAKPVTGKLFD